MLWHAGTKSRQSRIIDEIEQKLRLHNIGTKRGDFSAQSLTYWTPQRQCADRYAKYTNGFHDAVDITIIQLAVPESITNKLSQSRLYSVIGDKPNDDWKKMIWHCRNGLDLPPELEYLQKDIIMGDIALSTHCKYQKLKSWKDIKLTDRSMITLEDGAVKVAFQWVFYTAKARRAVEDECYNKIWFHDWHH